MLSKFLYSRSFIGVQHSVKRHVCSLGPLASAFNNRISNQFKFSWSPNTSKTGLFGIPELTEARGFQELRERCERNAADLVKEACSPDRRRNVAVIFDDLSDELCRVADMAEFVRLAHPDQDFALEAQNACIAVSGLVEELNTHLGIYSALKQTVEEGDRFPETEVDRHVAKLFLQDFQQCGIHLGDSDRKKVVELTDRILRLGQEFGSGCHIPRKVKWEQLPLQVRNSFYRERDGSVILSGQHIDSPCDATREVAYKIYYWREKGQEEILDSLLQDRYSLAKLCGYESFSARALANSLAQSPANINQFLSCLARQLPDRVKPDLEHMLFMKKRLNPSCKPLAMWDVPYFSGQARASWFRLDMERVCEHFSLGVAMDGLNSLFQDIYGVEMVVEETRDGELWAPDVFKLAVRDSTNTLGHIYCDFFIRKGKPQQDCHFTIRGGRQRSDGSYQDPVVVLMLNLDPPGWKSPTLLGPSTLDNLFHEVGHAMHSMLGRTKYQHVTGTRCSTDFAEVPSTLMEYFASDPRVLDRINMHYKTGEKLPQAVIEKLCDTKKIFASTELQAQLFYSAVDQAYHCPNPESDTTAGLARVQETHHTLPYVQGTAYQLRFSHLVGYGARYYSYMLARSVASAIWQSNFSADPFSRDAGTKYWAECLSHGGGKPSHTLVSDYLGKAMDSTQLAGALLQELDTKNREVMAALNRS